MQRCRTRTEIRWRRLGVVALILGLGQTPLPQPDFHVVRHHDGPGEACPNHDHLRTWHPGAGVADDRVVLHWHWFLPRPAGPEHDHHDGPTFDDAAPDWPIAPPGDGPQVAPPGRSIDLARLASLPASTPCLLFAPDLPSGPDPGLLRSRPRAFGATFAPGASLAPLLQRWTC